MHSQSMRLLAIPVLLGALVIGAHLVPGSGNSPVETSLRDSLHVLGFAAVAAALFALLPGSPLRRTLVALAAALVIGAFAETAQLISGQSFNAMDVLRDLSGAAAYFVARFLWMRAIGCSATHWGRHFLRLAVAGIGVLIVAPFLYWASYYWYYHQKFPTIIDFQSEMDARLVRPINATHLIDFDEGVARFEISDANWRGLLFFTVVGDWSEKRYLVLRADLPDAESWRLRAGLSDSDTVGSRQQLPLVQAEDESGFVEVRFPVQQDVPSGSPDTNLEHLTHIYIIVDKTGKEAALTLDRVWLE